jgi:hypothetical protein
LRYLVNSKVEKTKYSTLKKGGILGMLLKKDHSFTLTSWLFKKIKQVNQQKTKKHIIHFVDIYLPSKE